MIATCPFFDLLITSVYNLMRTDIVTKKIETIEVNNIVLVCCYLALLKTSSNMMNHKVPTVKKGHYNKNRQLCILYYCCCVYNFVILYV